MNCITLSLRLVPYTARLSGLSLIIYLTLNLWNLLMHGELTSFIWKALEGLQAYMTRKGFVLRLPFVARPIFSPIKGILE